MSTVIIGAIGQGLLWALLAIGIHITYRILNISDLTAEGSFTLGAAVFASTLVAGLNPFLATLLSILAGALAGLVTGLLHTKLNIPILLSSILSMTGLYSVNLRIMGKANISLNQEVTLLTYIKDLFNLGKDRDATIILGIIILIIIIAFLVWFFNTEFGFTIVATGCNPQMIRANGVNSNTSLIVGLMVANAVIALSGSVVSQYNGYADVGMGIGAIVIGLASLIIAEVIFRKRNFVVSLIGIVIGSIVYRLMVAAVINIDFISANDIRLFTSIAVAVAISIANSKLVSKGGKHA